MDGRDKPGHDENESLPTPSAGPQPLVQMCRRRRCDAHRVLVSGDRDHDLASMKMQARLTETRAVAINVVANDRPAHRSRVNAQLMGAAGDGFERKPGEPIAATPYFPVGDRLLSLRIGLLPPAALGIEAAEWHVDGALILGRSPLDDCPVGF